MSRSARRTADVTPSDTDDLPEPAEALYIGVGGAGKHVKVQVALDPPGTYRTFKNVRTGKRLNVAVTKVLDTGTTATDIVALLASEGGGVIGGGGGFEPTAMADFDFETGVYTFDGAPVALADFLGENLDWGSWDPANVVDGVGLVGDGATTSPVFVGDTATFLLQGATYIVDYAAETGTSASKISIDTFDLPDYVGETDAFSPGVDRFATASVTIGHNTANTGQIGANRTAMTVLFSHAAISLNGGAVASDDAAGVIPTTVACSVDVGLTLKRLRIYPMVADADLPGLSTP